MINEYKRFLTMQGKADNTIRAYIYCIKRLKNELGEVEKLTYIAFKNYREFLKSSGIKEATIN